MVFDITTTWSASVLPWQRDKLQQLLGMHRSGRLPHALMFSGPSGCGKSVFAASLVATLMCRQIDIDESVCSPCGECDGCNLARAGSHGDMRWLRPDEGKRAIGVEPVREAIRFVQRTAGYGSRKILVISPAEAMTTAAANALLKTLEEPAGDSLICLVCHRADDLPATVRSRCQVLAFPAPGFDEGLTWLRSQLPNNDCLETALILAAGQPIRALQLADSDGLAEMAEIYQVLEALLNRQHSSAVATQLLSGADIDSILDAACAVIETTIKADSSLAALTQYRKLFELRDQITDWAAGIRRGLNLSRDSLVAHMCNQLYTAVS